MKLRELPARAITGGFILHSGLDKWGGTEDTAKAILAGQKGWALRDSNPRPLPCKGSALAS
jgi:hypothetical protein